MGTMRIEKLIFHRSIVAARNETGASGAAVAVAVGAIAAGAVATPVK